MGSTGFISELCTVLELAGGDGRTTTRVYIVLQWY